MTLTDVFGRLTGAKPKRIDGCDGYEALCPCHDDHNPSLHVWEGANGWIQVKCRSCGASAKEFCAATGIENRDLKWRDDPKPAKSGKPKRGRPDREHHYHRADGSYAFTKQVWVDKATNKKEMLKVVKESPASSVVLRWKVDEDDKGLIYNLPQVLAAVAAEIPVHVGEGEKAADKAAELGHVATCQQDGAEVLSGDKCRWQDRHSKWLAGATVFVWADRDDVGEWYAGEVSKNLAKHALFVFTVRSRTTGAKDDMYDHLAAGFGADDGEPFDASGCKPPRKDKEPAFEDHPIAAQLEGRERPQIQTTFVQYRDTMQAVFSAMVERNDPPRLFVRNGTLAMVARHGDEGHKIVDAMDHDLRALSAEACDFVKWSDKKNALVPSDPPGRVEAMVRASRPWQGFPEVEGLSQCPVLRSDGTFATDTGYDKDTRAYVTDGPWPSASDKKEPLAWLLNEALGEFPFEDDASRDNALGLMLLPFVRRIIGCPTPVHYIEAPTVGTGKTLLAQTCLYPACGFVGASTLPDREEERKKSISSFLLEGAPAVIWDNVDKRVDSGTLASATTNARYHDRMLGSNSVIDVAVKCVWVMTGNNAVLSTDMMRRIVLVRIDAGMERPSQGRRFSKDLNEWCRKNRREMVGACCQAVLNWVDAGRPMFTERGMGGFEDYTRVIGGILAVNGRTAFIDNRARLESHSDPDSMGWASFHESVFDTYGAKWWRVADVLEKAEAIEELGEAVGTNPEGKRHKFGKSLKRRDGTVASELKLVTGRDNHTKQTSYRLVPTERHPAYDPYDDDKEPGTARPAAPAQTGLPYKDDE